MYNLYELFFILGFVYFDIEIKIDIIFENVCKIVFIIFWGDIDILEFLKLNNCIIDFLVMEIYV